MAAARPGYRSGMDWLLYAWGIALIVTLGALPPGVIRTLAYRSGEIDHTPTMRTAARFAVTLGVLGGVCLVGFTAALLLR